MTPEVRAFEYSLGIFSVLIGLAVADVAASFHRLLRHRSQVTWDPLALLAAAYALCMAVYMWFDIWGVRNFSATRHFLFYLGLVGQLFLLFLVAAASLPDEADSQTNLRDYYAGNSRYFWALVALFQLVYVAFGVFFAGGEPDKVPWSMLVLIWTLMTAPLLIALALSAWRARWLHYLGVGLLFVIMLLHYASAQIN
ncbi:MAG TPA: hypothetical protein VMT49_02125 [Steroidobacteraceae bacterium]|nr:hypothetical protein [Steroidobacteraceae bacterium]